MLITLLPRNMCSELFHQGCWLLKFLLVIGGFIGVFWIPNKFYYGWAHFARISSGIYLVLQIGMIVIAALKSNSSLVKSYEESGSCCAMFVLIATSLILTCGTLAFYVYQYIWFSSCGTNILYITIALVVMVGFYILNLLKTRKDASIFTASIVSAYISYLGWSAMASRPDEECNRFKSSVANLVS